MTARKPAGYACHVDEDLAHVASAPDEEVRPCTRRHRAAPSGMSTAEQTRAGLLPRTRVRLMPDPERTSKAPRERPAASSAARSTTKRARPGKAKRPPAGKGYDEATRLAVLEAMSPPPEGYGESVADAHRRTGIPKATLSRWAKAAGLELDEAARARTAAAAAHVEAKAAELKVTTAARLEAILELELETHERRAQLERAAMLEAVRCLNADGQLDDLVDGQRLVTVARTDDRLSILLKAPDSVLGQLLGTLGLLGDVAPKRDNVGAWTRAVHDLALLKGEATERGTILVRFGIPRPDGPAADAMAVDEVDLRRED